MDKRLDKDCSKLRKKIQQEQDKNRRLKIKISALKEEIKYAKNGKSTGRIKELNELLAGQEEANRNLHDVIYSLEQEKRQMLQSKDMISKSEYDGLLKQLERERQSKEQYQRLYEQEKARRKELKESFKTDNENKDVIYHSGGEIKSLIMRINELEAKLSRKGTGKPRNNSTTDDYVVELRNGGKTIREICRITGMSTTTVVKVIKNNK